MDIKLLACSSVAIASFSVLLFDYVTYTPTYSPATHHNVSRSAAASSAADETSQSLQPAQQTLNANVFKDPSTESYEPATSSAIETAKRLLSFEHPAIAGVLQPEGINRTDWAVDTSGPWVSNKPFETQRMVVMLDPGHGGTDTGAIAHNGLVEKHLTLDIAKRTREHLAKYPNIDVQFTREEDAGMSRSTRVKKIRYSDADILISLHFNHIPQTNIALVETYFAGMANIEDSLSRRKSHTHSLEHSNPSALTSSNADLSFSQGSKNLAETLQRHMFGEVERNNPAAHDAGVKSDTLFVLTQSFKTGALMELTCLSHPDEADKLQTEEYRNRLSKALAAAILEYRTSQIKRPLITPPSYAKPASIVNWAPVNQDRLAMDPYAV